MSDSDQLSLEERIRLVEDIWDSIAADQSDLPLSDEQRDELDRRLTAYRLDGESGRPAREVIEELRRRLGM